jgi:hypothetical protein
MAAVLADAIALTPSHHCQRRLSPLLQTPAQLTLSAGAKGQIAEAPRKQQRGRLPQSSLITSTGRRSTAAMVRAVLTAFSWV